MYSLGSKVVNTLSVPFQKKSLNMGFSTSVMCLAYSAHSLFLGFPWFCFPSLPAFRPVVFSSLRDCPVKDPSYLVVSFRFRSVRICRLLSRVLRDRRAFVVWHVKHRCWIQTEKITWANVSLICFVFLIVCPTARFLRKQNRQTVFYDHSTHRSVQPIRRRGNRADRADCDRRYRAYSDGVYACTSPASGQR